MDVVRQIKSFNAQREPERPRLTYAAMRASTFAFLRGSCHLFYERLPKGGVLLEASHACAAQVRSDAAEFNAAFDDGALRA